MARGKRKIIDEDEDLDIDIDEYGGIRPEYEVLVKKCLCGFRGELIPDGNGYACADCGYLLINSR